VSQKAERIYMPVYLATLKKVCKTKTAIEMRTNDARNDTECKIQTESDTRGSVRVAVMTKAKAK
jgi:hypothetical protein